MKFFFDNNLSAHHAHAIRELSKISPEVRAVVHLSDRFPRNVPDVEWIGELAREGHWYIPSKDRFDKNRDSEREALRRAGHTVFVLDKQWSEQKFWAQAERLVKWWPQVIQQAKLFSGGGLRVPWHHSTSAKFSSIKL